MRQLCMRKLRLPIGLLLSTVAVLIAVMSGTLRAQNQPKTPAELWLSWSPDARANYVWGYLSGFERGKREACSLYASKLEEPTRKSRAAKDMRLLCLQALPHFTAPYFQHYVDAITSYYSKYPGDREAGIPRIMLELASPPGLTIEQIHEKLSGQTRN
jgi:hypothetical protein